MAAENTEKKSALKERRDALFASSEFFSEAVKRMVGLANRLGRTCKHRWDDGSWAWRRDKVSTTPIRWCSICGAHDAEIIKIP